jgi:uncharacterized protein
VIAVLVDLDLHVPAARSLKDKRGVIKRLQNRLRDDLHTSVAEVAHQDLWQRCGLGIAIACRDEVVGRAVVQDVERIVARADGVELLDLHVTVVQSEHDGFSLAGGPVAGGAA